MDIIQAHSDTWGKQRKAGNVQASRKAAEAVKRLLKQIADMSESTQRKLFTPEQIRMAAKGFNRKTST